ncbi:chaplin family protein [Nocardiopsis coralliicola]
MMKKMIAAGAVAAASAGVLMFGAPAAFASDGPHTSGNGSILGGNQLDTTVQVPVNACGNSIAILGLSGASCDNSGAVAID